MNTPSRPNLPTTTRYDGCPDEYPESANGTEYAADEVTDMNERNAGLWVALLLNIVTMVVAGAIGVAMARGALESGAGNEWPFIGTAMVALVGILGSGFAGYRIAQRLIAEAVG